MDRLHGRRWRRYWRNNFVIRLVPDNVIPAEASARMEDNSLENWIEEADHWGHDEPEETIEVFDATNRTI